MNGIESAVKDDLFTTNGRDVFRVMEVRTKTIITLRNLLTGKTAEMESDNDFVKMLVKIVQPQRTQRAQSFIDPQKEKKTRKITEDLGMGEGPEIRRRISDLKFQKNKYPGVYYKPGKKASTKQWTANINRTKFKWCEHFATQQQAIAALDAKIKEKGFKPINPCYLSQIKMLEKMDLKELAAATENKMPTGGEYRGDFVIYECTNCEKEFTAKPDKCPKCGHFSFVKKQYGMPVRDTANESAT